MSTNEKKYLNRFNFGSFLNLCFETLKEHYVIYEGDTPYSYDNRKYNLPRLVFSCFLSQREINERSYATRDYAHGLYSNTKGISADIASPFITRENFDRVLVYVKRNLVPNLNKYETFLADLALMSGKDTQFSHIPYDVQNPGNENNAIFITKCLIHTFEVSNRIDEVRIAQKKRQKLYYEKNKAIRTTDPDHETTIQIRLYSLNIKNPRLYHNIDTCLYDIMNQGYIIQEISSKTGYIDISVQTSKSMAIRRLRQEDYPMAISLLEKYSKEFRPKIKWNGRSIAQLVQEGLEKRKWMSYGYFRDKELIGYIDYKICVDGIIEIGTLIVDEDYRDQGIGASLMNLFRLKFFCTPLYSGTYEENTSMISTFKKTGFHEYNIEAGTNKRRERVSPEEPTKFTNSVYYITDPLLKPKI